MQEMKDLITRFFELTTITIERLDISVEESEVTINIQTPDSSLLIGQHGKNIEILKHLLGRMLENIAESRITIALEVNDYMKAKDERFYNFLESRIAFATNTGKEVRIQNLTSFERKKAHNYISEKNIENLSTHSEGEGEARVLCILYTGTPVAPTSTTTTSALEELSEDGVGI